MKKNFICTRPSLASLLIESGEQATKQVNPYKTEFTTWNFTLNDNVKSIATKYYNDIGKPLPKALQGGVN